jgi:hypothetical protein
VTTEPTTPTTEPTTDPPTSAIDPAPTTEPAPTPQAQQQPLEETTDSAGDPARNLPNQQDRPDGQVSDAAPTSVWWPGRGGVQLLGLSSREATTLLV